MIKITTLFAALTILTVAGCAKISTYSTNLDSENFRHYFSPSKVAQFQSEQEFSGKYKMLGGVEGEDCQEKAHMAAPDPAIARTNARRKAFELGANAIVFSGCAVVETKQCYSSTICYGKAYQVETTDSE